MNCYCLSISIWWTVSMLAWSCCSWISSCSFTILWWIFLISSLIWAICYSPTFLSPVTSHGWYNKSVIDNLSYGCGLVRDENMLLNSGVIAIPALCAHWVSHSSQNYLYLYSQSIRYKSSFLESAWRNGGLPKNMEKRMTPSENKSVCSGLYPFLLHIFWSSISGAIYDKVPLHS